MLCDYLQLQSKQRSLLLFSDLCLLEALLELNMKSHKTNKTVTSNAENWISPAAESLCLLQHLVLNL